MSPADDRAIAIIGMSCRFPGASSVREYWDVLMAGRCTIGEVPAERFDAKALHHPDPHHEGTMVSTLGGFLGGVADFDADFFHLTPHQTVRMDPQHRLLLESAYEAVEDAGLRLGDMAGSNTAVYTGVGLMSEYWDMLRDAGMTDLHSFVGAGTHSTAAGRLSHALDLRGPSLAVDASCATGLTAVQVACDALRANDIEMAMVGGVSVQLSPDYSVALSKGTVISPTGRCRFGDTSADGYVRSEGVATLVLKRLSDAVEAGDRIHAVIAGIASGNDGRSGGSMMRPSVVGQERVLRAAYRDAGVSPGDVAYVEAHGTGTVTGDGVELSALGNVLGTGRQAGSRCLVGSAKSNIGHVEAAAGLAGLIKTVLAMRHGIVPQTLHVDDPVPLIADRELPLELATARQPWPRTDLRVAGVSNFGISGSNTHVVLVAPPKLPQDMPAARHRPYLVPLSAREPKALARLAESTANRLDDGLDLQDVAFSAGMHRSHHPYRLAVVGDDTAEVSRLLAGRTAAGRPDERAPKVVFVFSGQGSHWAGMARELLAEPVFHDRLRACDRAVRAETGFSPLRMLAAGRLPSGPCEVQSTLWAVQVALAAMWQHWGVVPDEVLGQSMGEISAATVAGALTLAEGAAIACRRARLIGQLPAGGGMAVVRLPMLDAAVQIAEFADRVSVGVVAGHTSTVLSGDRDVLATIVDRLRADGVFGQLIDVGYASHSPHVDQLRPELLDQLAMVRPTAGRVPLWSTVTGQLVDGSGMDAEYWADNLRQPVLLAPAIRAAAALDRPTVFVEISPHPLLLAEIEELLAADDRAGVAVGSIRRDEHGLRSLLRSAAEAYVAGCELDWLAVNGPGRYLDLPAYPWQRKRFWPIDGDSDIDTVLSWDGSMAASTEETLGTAAEELLAGSGYEVRRLRVVCPLPRDASALTARVVLHANGSGWRFELHGARTSPGPTRRWCVHATGLLARTATRSTQQPDRTAQQARPKPPDMVKVLVDNVVSLLELSTDEIDPSRHLSSLGLDSLMAARLSTRLSNDLGIPVSLAVLLSGTPIGELAAELSQAVAAS